MNAHTTTRRAVLALPLLTAAPLPAEGFELFTYRVTAETVGITDYSIRGSGEVAIPDEIDGKPVTEIGGRVFYTCRLTSITIPPSFTSIGEEAFSGCTGLTGVTIPSSVTSIGRSAFYGCTGLTAIVVDPRNPNYASEDGVLLSATLTRE